MDHGGDHRKATYSCHCLNIRVSSSQPDDPNPPLVADEESKGEFTKIYVAEDGVQATHPQLVLRHRTRAAPINGKAHITQCVSLTCLVCQFLVYRVYQAVPEDLECKEGPILPTEQWVEAEIVKSQSGWIELHNGCLSGHGMQQVERSPRFSSLFSILLPSTPSPPQPALPSNEELTPSSVKYLSEMKTIFPAPPFVPTHPTWTHLSKFAIEESDRLRSRCEAEIALFVKQKAKEIEASEAILRQQVEILWNRFREGVTTAERDRHPSTSRSPISRQIDSTGVLSASPASPPAAPLSSVRDFVPLQVVPIRASSSSAVPRVSSLSASLATSSFHHPRRMSGRGSPRSPSSTSGPISDSGSSVTLTNHPGASTESNVLQFKRNNNDAINTAVSYRYFMTLEEEMARRKRDQPSENQPEPAAETSTKPRPPGLNGNHAERQQGEASPSAKSKGKRKVTFDIGPESGDERHQERNDAQEMVFDLEEEGSESRPQLLNVLPLVEQPAVVRPRQSSSRKVFGANVPDSFSALISSSLPPYTPLRSDLQEDTTHISATLPTPSQVVVEREVQISESDASQESPNELDLREAEVLRLVAAHTPSHRAAWRNGALQKFLGNQIAPNGVPSVEEEHENMAGLSAQPEAASSLPIPVNQIRPHQELNLASYREPSQASQATTQPQPEVSHSHPNLTSAAMRRAAYAERDRRRALDPGALDFFSEEEEEPAEELPVEGSRGRDRALRILQARSSIPEAGMWRSLA